MKYFYDGVDGQIPNIGVFSNGDEIPADVAKKLKDAGYQVREEKDKTSAPKGEGE